LKEIHEDHLAHDPHYFWALKDVNLEVKQGEVVGIIGRNGAGKSTLLKILSRITPPTSGKITYHGRVSSLLEVGTGFHRELTGRENIFLNGSILGMKRSEIARQFDEIVAFAEVERFIDTPVKFYSSGMYVRLAFAVAAHLEPEILVVDEVLAVGDAEFQKKCLGKMSTVARSGRTVLFVSHNMGAVRGLCSRAIWLNQGAVMKEGDVNSVVEAYLAPTAVNSVRLTNPAYGFTVIDVVLRNSSGESTQQFYPGDDLYVDLIYDARQQIRRPYLYLVVQSIWGMCFQASMLLDGHNPELLSGQGRLRCCFKAIPLLPQEYSIRLCIRAADVSVGIIEPQDVVSFSVLGNPHDYGLNSVHANRLAGDSFPVIIPYEWTLPDGSTHSVQLHGVAPVASNKSN
jgi:lipopolysaccharide transport system ATP-binding protein